LDSNVVVGNILFRISQAFGNYFTDLSVVNISVNARRSGLYFSGGSLGSDSSRGLLLNGSRGVLGSLDSFVNISVQDSSVRSRSSDGVDGNTSGISSYSGDRAGKYTLTGGSDGGSRLVSLGRRRSRSGFNGSSRGGRGGSLRTPVSEGSDVFLVFNQNS
jgi:hypothetical protein